MVLLLVLVFWFFFGTNDCDFNISTVHCKKSVTTTVCDRQRKDQNGNKQPPQVMCQNCYWWTRKKEKVGENEMAKANKKVSKKKRRAGRILITPKGHHEKDATLGRIVPGRQSGKPWVERQKTNSNKNAKKSFIHEGL
ncbi:hypothetical protein BDZ97DRAFT_687381 [Flammula alnicola]|nr:hypothetical protein BDZ97DRAFT_687381 [Flammula alnicola]